MSLGVKVALTTILFYLVMASTALAVLDWKPPYTR